ncbi:MAG: crosslink repair DNA glycosylase YcaQ family protein [Thermoanaerobaculia bacterium]
MEGGTGEDRLTAARGGRPLAGALGHPVPLERARAFWVARQGLASPQEGSLHDVVARTGWLRTLGGADVYLALRARVPGVSRAAVDAESAALRLRVVPAARGCIYLVPEAHVPLALRVAEASWRPRTEREVGKAGASWKEVEACAAAIVSALDAPATTDALRRALPAGALRSLGEAGKKVGISSLLPIALRLLELEGKVERTLEGGRLDSERYLWRRAKKNVLASAKVPSSPSARNAELLRLFLSWSGPATPKELAAWSGLSLAEVRAAAALLDPVTVDVEGHAGDALLLPGDEEALLGVREPATVRLLSFEDNLLAAHGGPGVLVAPEDRDRSVESWGSSRPSTLGSAAHLARRTVLAGRTLAGFWELDADGGRVVTSLFRRLSRKEADALERLSGETARFLLDEVGHGRSFSLDTDENVRERARALTPS